MQLYENAGRWHFGEGQPGQGAGGIAGLRLFGFFVGAAAQSRWLSFGMGMYGASMSVYSHFLARGRDVVFPKNAAMDIDLGATSVAPMKPAKGSPTRQ